MQHGVTTPKTDFTVVSKGMTGITYFSGFTTFVYCMKYYGVSVSCNNPKVFIFCPSLSFIKRKIITGTNTLKKEESMTHA